MRKVFIILFLLFSITSFSQSQNDMLKNMVEDYRKSDKELNEIYQKILKVYVADAVFIENLKVAQRLWVKFRDAELKMKFPEREQGYYGSMLSWCEFNYLKQLTDDRIKTLKQWLYTPEEGDVCMGSVEVFEGDI